MLPLLCVQVEYYFSRENLCQDSFLVSKMDSQHYVDVAIIADFKMVKQLTSDTELILSCVANSDKVGGDVETRRAPVGCCVLVFAPCLASQERTDPGSLGTARQQPKQSSL